MRNHLAHGWRLEAESGFATTRPRIGTATCP